METMTYRIDGHNVYEHTLEAPLDHNASQDQDQDERVTVFAREFVRDGGTDRPRLVWFQGGPGNRGNRPDTVSGWLDRALQDYRVVILDQRGTGLSSPADRITVPARGDAAAQADYLGHFRADSVVRDAEMLRQELGDAPWTVLGQSYGGFVITTYLSLAPKGLQAAMITGGLPSLTAHADEVYRLTYQQTARRNTDYFARYHDDEATARDVSAHLDNEEELLPTGERLSSRRFRQLGIGLGTASGFDSLHYLLEAPFITVGGRRRLRERFLIDAGTALTYAAHPLYALMHETIYAQGPLHGGATAWSAHRTRDEFPEFALETEPGTPFRFTGEHIYPWQFEEDPSLLSLRGAAEVLAHRENFTPLYDPEALATNKVPLSAAIYYEDMFVPRELSLATASVIRGTRPIITNAYQHDGIRMDGPNLLDQLITALRR